jgi:hypothetical protein
MNSAQIQQKVDKLIGIKSKFESKDDDSFQLVYVTHCGFVLAIIRFLWNGRRWAFAGYEEGFQQHWSDFVKIARTK